jgi:NADPH:quinone reductase-like Zn-dependent oxidoreductase
MKAVRIHTYGDVNVLSYEDAPVPAPGAGEVLIRVHATTVNPFDLAVRAGYMSGYFNYSLPLTLGSDASGVIEATGPGVVGLKRGDPVFTRAGVFRDGANAEYVLAFASDVVAKPASLDHVHAAAIPHVGLTAWQALFGMAGLQKGQTVLIHGVAGGVGHMAAQLAKSRGAHVIGTASQNLEFARSLGLDQVIDYASEQFEKSVREVDVVLDTVGGDTQERSWAVLKPGGMLVSTVQAPSQEIADAHGVRCGLVTETPPMKEVLTELVALLDSGQLKPHVSAILPLEEIHKAHAMIGGRHTRGKIALQVVQ